MAELEEIVERRNYKLRIDWSCESCGSHTDMVGCVLPGEKCYEDRKCQVTWEDILHKSCKKCGLVRKPLIECDKCNTIYPFGTLGCNKCDEEIEIVIDLQYKYNIIKEQIRREKRKKNDVTELQISSDSLYQKLNDMKYLPCGFCGSEFIWSPKPLGVLPKCFDCGRD